VHNINFVCSDWIQDVTASTRDFETRDNFAKLPPALVNIQNDISDAIARTRAVVEDEIICTTDEIQNDCELPPDITDWNGDLKRVGSREILFYPGKRLIFDYELDEVSNENLSRYTYESLVFSFVVFLELGRLLSK